MRLMQTVIALLPVRGGRCSRCWVPLSDDAQNPFFTESKAAVNTLWQLFEEESELCYACYRAGDPWQEAEYVETPDGLGWFYGACPTQSVHPSPCRMVGLDATAMHPRLFVSAAGIGATREDGLDALSQPDDVWPGLGAGAFTANILRYHLKRLQIAINDLEYRLEHHTREPMPNRLSHPQVLAQLVHTGDDELIHRVHPFPPDGTPHVAPERIVSEEAISKTKQVESAS